MIRKAFRVPSRTFLRVFSTLFVALTGLVTVLGLLSMREMAADGRVVLAEVVELVPEGGTVETTDELHYMVRFTTEDYETHVEKLYTEAGDPRYDVGDHIEVRYLPRDPAMNLALAEKKQEPFGITTVPAIMLVIGVGGAIYAWRRPKPEVGRPEQAR